MNRSHSGDARATTVLVWAQGQLFSIKSYAGTEQGNEDMRIIRPCCPCSLVTDTANLLPVLWIYDDRRGDN